MEYSRSIGRSDFIGNIDNESLDFGNFEALIQSGNNGANNHQTPTSSSLSSNTVAQSIENHQSRLPETPPDSSGGSEPPYSPRDLNTLQEQTRHNIDHNQNNLSDTNTMLTSTLNLSLSQQQQLSINTSLDGNSSILSSTSPIYLNHTSLNSIHPKQCNNELITSVAEHMLLQPTSTLLDLGGHDRNGRVYGSNELINLGISHSQHLSASDIQTITADELSRLISSDQLYTQHILAHPALGGSGGHIHMSSLAMNPQLYTTDPINYHHQLDQVQHSTDAISPQTMLSNEQSVSTPVTTASAINLIQSSGSNSTSSSRKRKSHSQNESMEWVSTASIVKPESGSTSPDSEIVLCCTSSVNLPTFTGNAQQFQEQMENQTDQGTLQCIRFSSFQKHQWHILCDQNLHELSTPHYRVDADKGFNFSNSDEAFVCQKKNHFQITCHSQLQGNAIFVQTPTGSLEKIRSFHLHFYGVKSEAPAQTIRVEQSQSDRSKKPFHPVLVDLQNGQVSKVTVGRLHFSETTSNNMRKKGRPNPDQKYFQLVVGLHAHTSTGDFVIISQASERIIVRASNPGQFESDTEVCWPRGITQDSIYHMGRVGINTDRPDECLVVHGNIKVSGHVIQPSDCRAKEVICELDTARQLENVQKMRVVRFRYKPEYAQYSGLSCSRDDKAVLDTGVIAQEIQKILPDAVKGSEQIVLPNGEVIEDFLLVNKDRILSETIGAIKELGKVTSLLNTRIDELERLFVRVDETAPETSHSLVCSMTGTICIKIMQCLLFFFVIFVAWFIKNIFFMSSN